MCVASLHQQRIVQGREVAENVFCRTMPVIDSIPVWGPLITMIENTSRALLIELRFGSTASALASAVKVAPPLLSRAHILAQATEHGVDE